MKVSSFTGFIIGLASIGAETLAQPAIGFPAFEIVAIQSGFPDSGMVICESENLSEVDEMSFDIFIIPVSEDEAILLNLDEVMVMNPPEVVSIGVLRCDVGETQWLKTDLEQSIFGDAMFESNGVALMQSWIDDIVENNFLSTETLEVSHAQNCACDFLGSDFGREFLASQASLIFEEQKGDDQ